MNAVFLWKKALRRKSVWFSLLVMLFFGLVALLAPWLSPHDPYRLDIAQADRPPMWVQDLPKPGLAEFPLGTDRLGRDVLSRLIYGTRTAFLLAVLAVPLAALLGTWAGLISGYAGGRLDVHNPGQSSQGIRNKTARDSGACRPPNPEEGGHFLRTNRNRWPGSIGIQ